VLTFVLREVGVNAADLRGVQIERPPLIAGKGARFSIRRLYERLTAVD
jgi:hypothetical protein